MTAPDDMTAILQRISADADRLLAASDPLLAGQVRALRSRIDVLLALVADAAAP